MNRPGDIISEVASNKQSAFIKGRNISDNISLMQEVVRGYHRNNGLPRCALKIDLMKVYDFIIWGFIVDILTAMNFPKKVIN